jgi:tRNA (adenine57-N1/adenine58-N1)-methyltransferase catalytic subunit
VNVKETETTQRPLAQGERVLLTPLEDTRATKGFLVALTGSTVRIEGLGVIDTKNLVDKEEGTVHEIGTRRFLVLRPDLRDQQSLLRRKAQLILPKDAAQILMGCAIGPGSHVAEAGVGSGALTLALAWTVGEHGRVYAYELREDHLETGRRNLERAGMLERVQLHLGDISQGISQRHLDAVVLDMPEPWNVLPVVTQALRPGGRFAGYCPTVPQMEATVVGLREHGFLEVEAIEVLTRSWHVLDRSVRPSFEMLGHTAWLVFGRWPGEKALQPHD